MVVKRYRHLGDFASAGVALLSMYNPDLLYVEANLEEDRLPGVEPGNPVRIELDAFAEPFRGRVVWVNKSTGAQFALMPRNVVSGEFTQRGAAGAGAHPDRDGRPLAAAPRRADRRRWPSPMAPAMPPGPREAARAMAELETRYNAPQHPEEPARDGDSAGTTGAATP